MATAKQIEANRRNAQRSTGPRSEAGKARSRANALKHGLAGEGLVLPVEEAAAVRERMAEWNSALKPTDAFGMWLLEVVATEAVRVEKCRVRERVLRSEAVARAEENWDEDRRREAEAIAASLPTDPPRAVARLRASVQGCRLLREWWLGLARALEGSAWTGAQESLALDLLGVPAPLREGAASPLHAESERGRRLRCSAIVAEELARLDRLIEEVLPGREERRREAAALDMPEEQPRGVGQCRRYEAQCMRRLRWAREQIAPPPAPRRSPGPVGGGDGPRAEEAPVASGPPPYPWRAPDGSLRDDDPTLPRSLRRLLPDLVRSALATWPEAHREAAEAEPSPLPAPPFGRAGPAAPGRGRCSGRGRPPSGSTVVGAPGERGSGPPHSRSWSPRAVEARPGRAGRRPNEPNRDREARRSPPRTGPPVDPRAHLDGRSEVRIGSGRGAAPSAFALPRRTVAIRQVRGGNRLTCAGARRILSERDVAFGGHDPPRPRELRGASPCQPRASSRSSAASVRLAST